MATLTTLDAALKIQYLPGVVEQLNQERSWYSKIEKQTEGWAGRQLFWTTHPQRSGGWGARAEAGGLPRRGAQAVAGPNLTAKYLWGRINLTEQVMHASTKDQSMVGSAMDFEMEGLMNDLKRDSNRQLMDGNGNGALCLTNGTGSSAATVTVDTPGTQFVEVGSYIDSFTAEASGGSTGITAQQVTGKTATTLTLGGNESWANNEFISYEGSRGNEWLGLRGIVDDGTVVGTLYSIDRTTTANAYWDARLSGNSGTNRPLTEVLLQTVIDDIEDNSDANADDIDWIISGRPVRRQYMNILVPDKRFINTMDLGGGFKALEYNGKAWIADRDVRANRVYLINSKSFTLAQLAPLSGMDKDGSILHRSTGDDGSYDAAAYVFGELKCDAPNRNGLLSDITE